MSFGERIFQIIFYNNTITQCDKPCIRRSVNILGRFNWLFDSLASSLCLVFFKSLPCLFEYLVCLFESLPCLFESLPYLFEFLPRPFESLPCFFKSLALSLCLVFLSLCLVFLSLCLVFLSFCLLFLSLWPVLKWMLSDPLSIILSQFESIWVNFTTVGAFISRQA